MLQEHKSSPLLTDLYQLTMAQGYYQNQQSNSEACFYMFYREYPFKGGYAIACGIEQFLEYIEKFSFSSKDINYLKSIKDSADHQLFNNDFLNYLETLELKLNIKCVNDGDIVFPNEPIVRVTGPMMDCQLIETALLNAINFQTLIATKASRICFAADCPIMEFGQRRAQGYCGGIWASRAAFVGGCTSTSNVLAGKEFDIPVAGTHAHSWVMSFDNELDAFRAYAKEFPNNCVLLIDTYDTKQGLQNAIKVGLEMKQRGEKLAGVRIDSGDLTWISKHVREQLDNAGLTDCGIVLSNDLDEYSIKSIRTEGGSFTSLGVGTKLATAYDQPSLGGVYKLSAIKKNKSKKWKPLMKLSESTAKRTIPGILDIKRYYNKDNKLIGDMIYDKDIPINNSQIIVDPMDNMRRKKLDTFKSYDLLQMQIKNGKRICKPQTTKEAQHRALSSLQMLDETQKRTIYPHTYPVGLEQNLSKTRNNMIKKLKGFE